MKKYFLFHLLLFAASGCVAQSKDCARFTNGRFYYPDLPNKISLRKDSTQESYNDGRLEMIWKVKWSSDCEYELILEKVLVHPYLLKVGDRISVKIIETDGDCFTSATVLYNEAYPKGLVIPPGKMCFEKEIKVQ